MPKEGLTRLLSSMVVSKSFGKRVLNPETRTEAIKEGYLGVKFDISPEELEILNSYGYADLTEFGQLINRDLKNKRLG